MKTMISALYDNITIAYFVALTLKKRRLNGEDIGLISKAYRESTDNRRAGHFSSEANATEWPESREIFGKLRDVLNQIVTIQVQGMGPVIFAGAPFASRKGLEKDPDELPTVLTQLGVWGDETDILVEGVQQGHVLLLVNAPTETVSVASDIMRAFDPVRIEYHSSNLPENGRRSHTELSSVGETLDLDDTQPSKEHLENGLNPVHQGKDSSLSINESDGLTYPG